MNRRAFLSGLLASTTAIPIAKAAPLAADGLLTVDGVQLYFDQSRRFYIGAGMKHTVIYWTEAVPVEFTGFQSFTPQPAWAKDVYDVVKARMDELDWSLPFPTEKQ